MEKDCQIRTQSSSPFSEKTYASGEKSVEQGCSYYCQFCMDTTHVIDNCQFARKMAPEEVEAKGKRLLSEKLSSLSTLSLNSSEDGQYSDNEMPPPSDLPGLISTDDTRTDISLRNNSQSSLTQSFKVLSSCEQNSITSTNSEESESIKIKYNDLKSWVKSLLSLDIVRQELFMNNPLLASEVVKFL